MPPNTTELREISDVQHYYNGLPVTSFLCLPGPEGVDPHSVNKQEDDSPTVNNQGGLHLFSLTGGSSIIPGVIALGIVLWLGWKGWRKFRGYKRKKEVKAPKKIREIFRQEGESVDSGSSDSNDDNDGGGSRLKPPRRTGE